MVPDPAPDDSALPRRAPDLSPGHPAPARPEAASRGWLKWLAVAGLCLAIWGGLALVWPLWEKHRAYEIVAEHFRWNEKEKAAMVREESTGTGPSALRELDRRTARALRVLGTQRLEISRCPGITSVAALKDTATLKFVFISECDGLTSVAGLPEGVQLLRFNGCQGLASVEGLPPSLPELGLNGCKGLTSVAGLPTGLQGLSLNGCTRLTSVAGLPEGVQELYLRQCTGLTSVAGLPAGVQKLDLGYCWHLTSVAGLPAGVKELDLSRCTRLTTVAELPEGVQTLILSYCTGLNEVGSLPPGLKEVWLNDTPKLPEAVKAEIRALVKKNGGEVGE